MFENSNNLKIDSLNMQSNKGCLENRIIFISKYIFFATTLNKSIYE